MTKTNQYIATEAARIVVPTDYATTADSGAENQAAVQQLMDIVAQEGTDGSDTDRLFMDEMSPAARISLYAHLAALKAAIVDVT